VAPANAAVNVNGTESVTLSPFGVTVVVLRLMLHRLFCKVAFAPGVPASQALPASLSSLADGVHTRYGSRTSR